MPLPPTRLCLQLHRPPLTNKRNVAGGGGHVLGDEQHEDGESQQHRQPQRHLLAALRAHPEHQQRQRGQHDARDDDVVGVVKRAPAQVDDEADVGEGLRAAGVVDDVADGHHVQQDPLAVGHVVGQVHPAGAVHHVHLQV